MTGDGTSSAVPPSPGSSSTVAPDREAEAPEVGTQEAEVPDVEAPAESPATEPADSTGPDRRPLPRRFAGWLTGTRRGQATGAFLLYLVATLLIFGIPILRHPGTTFVGWGTDPSSFMWYLAWLPHAIGHGINPLVTHDVWAPVGFNLTHATAVYAPALVLTPVTLLFGPVVAYNVLALSAPVLSAWAAFLLCREVTRSLPAALVGGYLFGFSVYVMGQMLGHPNLALAFLVPVCALIVLRRVRGEISARRAALWLAAALSGQFLISLEVFMTLTIFGAVALALAAAFERDRRRKIARTAGTVAAAYGITAVVMAPFIVSFFSASNHAPIYDFYPAIYASDLVNFAVPTALTRVGSGAFAAVSAEFTGDISEQSAYFSIPVWLMLFGFAVTFSRRRWAAWLLAFTAVVAVCSFGPKLHVGGTETLTMPWKAALNLPLVKYALPGRFLLFAWLAVAVMAAAWLGRRQGVGRWVLAGFAVILLYPNTAGPFWHNAVDEPAFFADGTYREHIPEGANTLIVPFGAGGDSMLWQADSGFWFRMPVGNVGTRPPPEFGAWPAMDMLSSGNPGDASELELEQYLGANDVRRVVVVDGTPGEWNTVFAGLGEPEHVGGVRVYTVPGHVHRQFSGQPRPPG